MAGKGITVVKRNVNWKGETVSYVLRVGRKEKTVWASEIRQYEKVLTNAVILLNGEVRAKPGSHIETVRKERSAYWTPVRTIAGGKKDKWLECNICGNRINLADIEELRFSYRNYPEVYANTIKTEYEMCNNCKSKMDIHITHELRSRGIAKGDRCLAEVVKGLGGML